MFFKGFVRFTYRGRHIRHTHTHTHLAICVVLCDYIGLTPKQPLIVKAEVKHKALTSPTSSSPLTNSSDASDILN